MWYTERTRRMQILLVVIFGVMGLLLVRLFWMQVIQGPQYKKVAESNRIRQITVAAPRGVMCDRNGAVIVSNRASFAVSIVAAEYINPAMATPALAKLIGIPENEIVKLLEAGKEFPYTPVRVKRDADDALVAKINEHKYDLPGVIIEALPVRHYPYNELAAHVFGFVGVINEEEYAKRKNQGYGMSDLIGKDGLERELEDVLRGEEGGRQVEVNASGEEVELLGYKDPIPGRTVYLTIDANLQKLAEDALKEQITASKQLGEPAKSGCVVVLDIKTGGVLVMANSPSYDPNLFASGINSANWNKLIQDKREPLINKSIQTVYPPGSVFKIVTAAAALDLGYTTVDEIFRDRGVYVLNGWSFYGWETKGLGDLNIIDAIAWSSDPAFYELGRRMGANNLANYAVTFGFGQKTGIQLLGEETGVVPTEEWKAATYSEAWYPGETLIAAIGQGYYLATPMQQALLLMAVANRGVMYKPRLIDRVWNSDGSVSQEFPAEVLRMIYLRPEHWEAICQGLAAVVSRGTASNAFKGFTPAVAGKTGSAESGRGTVHSWFACYAPADRPEIAAVAFVEDGGEGSVAAAPIMRRVLEAYFKQKTAKSQSEGE